MNDEARAAALVAEGKDLFAAASYSAALERFDQSLSLARTSRTLAFRGFALARLGRSLEAARDFQEYLDGPDRDPKIEGKVRAELDLIDPTLGHLELDVVGASDGDPVELKLGNGTWSVLTNPRLRVAAGAYRVQARRGARVAEAEGIVAAGQTVQVTLALPTPVATAGAAAVPTVEVSLAPSPRTRSRWSALAGGIGTVGDRGVRGVVGVGFRPIPRLRLGVDAILGKGPGLAPGATYYLVGDRLQPFVQASLPLRWLPSAEGGCGADCGMEVYGRCGGSTVSSIEAAGRLGVGVAWRLGDRTALHASAGLERYPFADGCRFSPTVVTPSLGLEARL